MGQDRRYFAVVVTSTLWFNEAIKGKVKVFHFPPNRKPRVGKLRKGDLCIIFLSDKRAFVGEFNVIEVKNVNAEEFKEYKPLAYETTKASFPRGEQRSWIIVFDKIRPYAKEVHQSEIEEIAHIPFRGFTLFTERYYNALEKIREKGRIVEVRPPKSFHDQLVDMICEIGKIMGYDRVEARFRHEGVEFDAIWQRRPRRNPTHVFEVQIKGNLYQALSKLKHAWDIWGSKVFLIAERDDLDKAKELIEGSFHELKDRIMLIEVDILKKFYNFKKRYAKVEYELETLP